MANLGVDESLVTCASADAMSARNLYVWNILVILKRLKASESSSAASHLPYLTETDPTRADGVVTAHTPASIFSSCRSSWAAPSTR